MKASFLASLLLALPLLAADNLPLSSSDTELESRLSELKASAESGDLHATQQVYMNYAVRNKMEEAQAWAQRYVEQLEKKAEGGDSKAMMLLGTDYLSGKDYVKPDRTKAAAWMSRASAAGEPSAAFILGQLMDEQQQPEEAQLQYARAYGLYKELYAKQPNSDLLYWLGYMEQNGLGCEARPAEGMAKLEEAAEEGNAWAYNQLFKSYTKGIGCEIDTGKAIGYAAKLADTNGDGLMAYAAAAAYSRGDNVEKDATKAEHYLELAVKANIPDAIYMKARLLQEKGKLHEALPLFAQAASMGQVDAMVACGRSYLFGEGVEKDEAQGLRYLQSACDRFQSPAAPYELARYYESLGEQALADSWYIAASNRGVVEAMARRGLLHIIPASGVDWSPTEAYRWWKFGAAQQDTSCKLYLNYFYYLFCPLLLVLVFGIPLLTSRYLNKKATQEEAEHGKQA